jgi:hypothetical protein
MGRLSGAAAPILSTRRGGFRLRPICLWLPGAAPLAYARPMSPKYHHTPLSGGDRKALGKELVKARAMTKIFAERSAEKRRLGEALIREADTLSCESWNEKMWSDGGPIDPSPTVEQAINGGYPWLEIECSRCKTPRDVDLAVLLTYRRRAFTISRRGSSVGSARALASVPLRHCSS